MRILNEIPQQDYRILVSRNDRRPQAQLYAFSIRQEIPKFLLSLQSGDTEPLVDLQALLLGVRSPTLSAAQNKLLSSFKPNHVAISVPNLEEAVRWYQEKLGFRVTKITEISEISAKRAWLDLNGFIMEIFVLPKSTSAIAAPESY